MVRETRMIGLFDRRKRQWF